MDMTQYMAMIRNLDPQTTGFIESKKLLTYFILLESKVPTEAEASAITKLADQDGCIAKEAFIAANFWFDQTESSKDLPENEPFERKQEIKSVLFDANAVAQEGKEGSCVVAADLVATLRLPAERKDCALFKDFIFAPIKNAQK